MTRVIPVTVVMDTNVLGIRPADLVEGASFQASQLGPWTEGLRLCLIPCHWVIEYEAAAKSANLQRRAVLNRCRSHY